MLIIRKGKALVRPPSYMANVLADIESGKLDHQAHIPRLLMSLK